MEKELTQIWDDVVEGSSNENIDSLDKDWQNFLNLLNKLSSLKEVF